MRYMQKLYGSPRDKIIISKIRKVQKQTFLVANIFARTKKNNAARSSN
jgi:hypothetical protein